MKKQILTGIIALGTAAGALAQSSITFDNSGANAAGTVTSPDHGQLFVNGVPLGQDINLTLLGGANAGSMSTIATYLLADGTADLDWGFLATPGQFADPNGNVYAVNGVAAGGTATLQVEAWLGLDTSYAAALADGSAVGTSGIYTSPTGGTTAGGAIPPVSIGDNMPAFNVKAAPEPATFALLGLGASSLLLFRREMKENEG